RLGRHLGRRQPRACSSPVRAAARTSARADARVGLGLVHGQRRPRIVYDLAVELGDEFRWSALVFRAKRHLGAALQCAKEGRGMSGLGLWATAFRWLAGTSDASALKLDGLSNAAETHLWTALSAWVSVEAFARTGRSGTIFRWLVPRDFLEEWG
ncbi:unnamed protein product, partial [Prorocentrum cordatum]